MPTTSGNLPQPARFLRLGWRGLRRAPTAFLVRAVFELFAYAVRAFALFGAGLLVVTHLALFLGSGGAPSAWPETFGATALRPGVLLGVLGAAFTLWAGLFAAESLAFAGVWSALRRGVQGADSTSLRLLLRGAVASFPEALKIRLFVRGAELTLVAVFIGTLAAAVPLGQWVAAVSKQPVLAPSVMWAVVLTVLTSSIALVRLSAELVAAAVYLDGVGLGEALLRAGQRVVSHPIYVYRLFVVAASVLIPPLLCAWAAALLQNFFVGSPQADTLGMLLRVGAEVAILLGFALFSVMLHATFFVYYQWERGGPVELDPAPVRPRRTMISLSELVPREYPYVVDVEELLGPWSDDDVLPTTPSTAAMAPRGAYDLGAILREGKDPQKTSDEDAE